MLRKLKRRLVYICGFTTTFIITLITLIALKFSIDQLNARCQLNLQNTLFSVVHQLQNQGLSYSWLAQVEANNETIIYISTDQNALSFPGSYITGETRASLIAEASQSVHTQYDLDELPISYKMHYEDGHYLVVYTPTYFNDIEYHVLLIQDLKPYDKQIVSMCIVFGILIILGSLLLILFSFWFVSKAIKPVEASQKEQKDFIAAASHEMRSPLAVICTSSDNLLEDERFREERYLHIINKESTKLTRFVNDLLFLANTDAGHWRIDVKPTEMDTLLLEVYDSFLPLVNKKEHLLDIELPSDQQPTIMIDPERITQVLSVLLNNALNYTPAGTKIILSLVNEKNTVKLSVIDNGPGITDQEKKDIFKRFYRADAARHDTDHYGLGLSVAYEIIKEHHGKLSVHDTPGGGATFTMTLPLQVK